MAGPGFLLLSKSSEGQGFHASTYKDASEVLEQTARNTLRHPSQPLNLCSWPRATPHSSPFSCDTLVRPLSPMDAFFCIAAPVPMEETEAEAQQIPADYDHTNSSAAFSCVVS